MHTSFFASILCNWQKKQSQDYDWQETSLILFKSDKPHISFFYEGIKNGDYGTIWRTIDDYWGKWWTLNIVSFVVKGIQETLFPHRLTSHCPGFWCFTNSRVKRESSKFPFIIWSYENQRNSIAYIKLLGRIHKPCWSIPVWSRTLFS